MEGLLKAAFRHELKVILAPYSDIIATIVIVAIIGYVIYKLYKKLHKTTTTTPKNTNNILTKCPNCGSAVSPKDKFCLKCGTALTSYPTDNSVSKNNSSSTFLQVVKYTIIGIIVIFILLVIIGLLVDDKQDTTQPTNQISTSSKLSYDNNNEEKTQVKETVNNDNQPASNKIDKIEITRDSLIGNWKNDNGDILSIDNGNFGKASYTISEFKTTDDGAQIKIALNGGRSMSVITFANNDASHFTIKNLSTGESVTYTRQ